METVLNRDQFLKVSTRTEGRMEAGFEIQEMFLNLVPKLGLSRFKLTLRDRLGEQKTFDATGR